jgi:hypothetical protein
MPRAVRADGLLEGLDSEAASEHLGERTNGLSAVEDGVSL